MRILTKSDITKEALLILNARNVEAWRNNNMAVRGRKFIGRRGVPDIIGFNRSTCVFTVVEVKTKGDKISDDQHEFLAMVQKSGGIAILAVQVGPNVELINYKPD